jgi:hypothetical protein
MTSKSKQPPRAEKPADKNRQPLPARKNSSRGTDADRDIDVRERGPNTGGGKLRPSDR